MALFDDLKAVGQVLQEAHKIPQYEQILAIQEKLLEMQKQIFDLDSENRELKEKLNTKETLKYDKSKNSYWADDGDGPFCSRCWDVDRKTVRLKPSHNPAFHICPECKTQVQTDPGYRPPYTIR